MAPPRSLPELIEDTAAEVLLRVPPDEPAHLVRASLVCKLWRRILLDPAFLRRYREFHRKPPLLGFLRNSITDNLTQSFRFVPTTSASPISAQPPFDCARWRVLSCRHGRVLLDTGFYSVELIVWDPITGDLQRLPRSDNNFSFHSSAAVLCASGTCNHLDCHGGPFLVVCVGSHEGRPGEMFARAGVYSSETGAWDTPALLNLPRNSCEVDRNKTGAIIGDNIYFSLELGEKILKFDLGSNSLSMMDPPDVYNCGVLLMPAEGSLGLAGIDGSKLYLWSREVDPKGDADWVQQRVIRIQKLFPNGNPRYRRSVLGFAEGVGAIFVKTDVGIFMMELKSGRKRKVRKVSEPEDCCGAIPFMRFYTPDCAIRKLQSTTETN